MTGSSYYDVEKASAWRSGGSTQAESRVYNERLILSLIRLHGELSKVELTHLTGLAPQTITLIVNGAAANDLLVRGAPRRGGLGQPSVPYALKPTGAASLGLSIGRNGCAVVLVNFAGGIVDEAHLANVVPAPEDVMDAVTAVVHDLLARHPSVSADRIAGLGIASPFHGTNWATRLGLTREQAIGWNRIDLRAELDSRFSFPVYLLPEGVVAASGELLFGAGLGRPDYLYIHLSECVSGGLVLDHRLFLGANRMAGTIGELMVTPLGVPSPPEKLEHLAGFGPLAKRFDGDHTAMHAALACDDADVDPRVTGWADESARAIAALASTSIGLLDVNNLVLGGEFSASVRKIVARSLRRHLSQTTATHPQPFSVAEGLLGKGAFALGGASVPLMVRYSSDKDVLLKNEVF